MTIPITTIELVLGNMPESLGVRFEPCANLDAYNVHTVYGTFILSRCEIRSCRSASMLGSLIVAKIKALELAASGNVRAEARRSIIKKLLEKEKDPVAQTMLRREANAVPGEKRRRIDMED